jgi:transketolase
MRSEFCNAMVELASDPNLLFLTGDLGFMALEPLESALGERFINAGVSEQNMVSVAAAMTKDGWQAWAYSIAPFVFARPFEQIRNDVCLHGLPVKLVGNGGGFGYGVQGPTHHAVEDYGTLLALPGMRAMVPCFNEDVAASVQRAHESADPCYLRLGRGELPAGQLAPRYAPWRQLLSGRGPSVVACGPIAGSAWATLAALSEAHRPNLWVVSELPFDAEAMPSTLQAQLNHDPRLLVIEEHVRQGGLGSQMATWVLEAGLPIRRFRHLYVRSLAMGVYGSQIYLRKQSGLDPDTILNTMMSLGQ